MAQTYISSALTPQAWDDQFFTNYVRESRFKRYFGTDEAAMIQIKEDLTRTKGDNVVFNLVSELTGTGVRGNATLKGNEERLNLNLHRLSINVLRHAVAVDDWDEQKSPIDIREAAKSRLRIWASTALRDDIKNALSSVAAGVNYADATAGEKNTWTANNQDRILFGASTTNYNATHATGLLTIDTTADQLTPNALSLMKRMAQAASPKIRPIYVKKMDQEWYVAFVGPRAWRDLTEDNPTTNVMTLANRDARERGLDNPLFTGDSLVWDGIMVRQIPEITAISGVGSASADVEPVYLMGAQALGIAWAQRTKSTTDTDDYGYLHGVGVQEMRGIDKLRFDPLSGTAYKDHGMVTGFFAAVSD
jgi:N4-gp56 family major capsid protein